MDDTQFIDSAGRPIAIPSDALQALAATVRGTLLTRGDSGYDAARTVWNAMIDRRPGLIIRCAGAADVMAGVRFARDHGLLLAVRGGSHNIAGHAVCDHGVMLDLTPMKSVRVDPAARTARVEPGVLLGEFDREAQAFGLATPLGINSTTGVAGLTLGGGFGWLSRAYRAHHRQPARRRHRDGGRHPQARQQGRESGPVLGRSAAAAATSASSRRSSSGFIWWDPR